MSNPGMADEPICMKCRVKPSEGKIFQLCWDCFLEFEAHINANQDEDGRYELSDKEFEYVNEPWAVRKQN